MAFPDMRFSPLYQTICYAKSFDIVIIKKHRACLRNSPLFNFTFFLPCAIIRTILPIMQEMILVLVLDTIGATIYGRAIGDVQDVPVRRIPCDRWKILVIIAFLSSSVFGHCQAEEHLFLNDNPRYPLIFAIDRNRRYLDLDSCAIISNDENGFEISAQCICQDMESNEPEKNQTFRFRKNAESNWKLQVWEEFWARYSSEWRTIPDPMELKDIEQTLDTKGYINYHFPAYYLFKCVYQQLFNEPYKDNIDDEVLRRSAIIPQDRDTSKIDPYLWGDKNYPCVWMYQGWAWNLDKSSVYVEMEAPSQYILRPRFGNTIPSRR